LIYKVLQQTVGAISGSRLSLYPDRINRINRMFQDVSGCFRMVRINIKIPFIVKKSLA